MQQMFQKAQRIKIREARPLHFSQNLSNRVNYTFFITISCLLLFSPSVALAAVDLVVDTLSIAPTNPALGGKITVSYKISNAGTSNSGGYSVRIYYSTDKTITTSDVLLDSFALLGLNAGVFTSGSRTITLPSTLTLGLGYIGIYVDWNKRVAEVSESNNTHAAPFTTRPPLSPDLKPTKLTTPTIVEFGTPLSVYYQIENLGLVNSPGFKVSIYLIDSYGDRTTLDTFTSTGLGVNTSTTGKRTVTIPHTALAGFGYLGIHVDWDGKISEGNESNNKRENKILLVGPDLIVSALTNAPTTQSPGHAISVSYQITNVRRYNRSVHAGAFGVRIYYSTDQYFSTNDIVLDTFTLPGLNAGVSISGTRTVLITQAVPSGAGYLLMYVNWDRKFGESTGRNNTRSAAITIPTVPRPELAASALTITPPHQSPNGEIKVNYKIDNTGMANASGVGVRIYHSKDDTITTSDTPLDTFLVTTLNVGASTSGTRTITAARHDPTRRRIHWDLCGLQCQVRREQ